ncbi:hypothetical protein MNEG_12736, partial [Monoraphidium neglectum]
MAEEEMRASALAAQNARLQVQLRELQELRERQEQQQQQQQQQPQQQQALHPA